jgi:histone-lysine N-methyltransferase EZH2
LSTRADLEQSSITPVFGYSASGKRPRDDGEAHLPSERSLKRPKHQLNSQHRNDVSGGAVTPRHMVKSDPNVIDLTGNDELLMQPALSRPQDPESARHVGAHRSKEPRERRTTIPESPPDSSTDDVARAAEGDLVMAKIDPLEAVMKGLSAYAPAFSYPLKNSTAVLDSNPHLSVERIVGRYAEEMRADSEYNVRVQLRRARTGADLRPSWPSHHRSLFVFDHMDPLQPTLMPERKSQKIPRNRVKLSVESFGTGSKGCKNYLLDCTLNEEVIPDVPSYSHYVSLRHNLLAHNETSLQHWPYFGDDFIMEEAEGLKDQYFIDVVFRERKLLRLGQAEEAAEYAEEMIQKIGCEWSDVLRFLLEPKPDVGRDAQALTNRDHMCSEDFQRTADRWQRVLLRLPSTTPEKLERAAIFCDQFQALVHFPLWHVARRTGYMEELLKQIEKRTLLPDTLDELICRVCLRFCCPHHGEIKESPDGRTAGDEVVETDIIHPPSVNFRYRVAFPKDSDSNSTIAKHRQNLEYWQRAPYNSLIYRQADERGPFYPCSHPGEPCNKDNCSCFRENIPCEKICGCSSECPRKFQGCSCSSDRAKKGKKRICYEDSRCTCYQLGKECDPDLCGECGVCEVLDPIHRHDDLEGLCHNASLQRGVSKHTILGQSLVHGFGLYACEDIREHDFVGEYVGEIITKDEAERRGAVYHHQKLSYLFSLNRDQEIDSTYFGNKMRFINHAAKGKYNIFPRIIMVNTVHRIALRAARNIRAGEELFFDYGPMFPDEQLGGTGTTKKAAPRMRNSELVGQFWDVQQSRDKKGNVRTTKAETRLRLGRQALSSDGSVDMEQAELDLHDVERRLYSYNVQDVDDDPGNDEDFEPDESFDEAGSVEEEEEQEADGGGEDDYDD